jgi:glyoxylase-like metal-dependent hydrolase (beta-lactamase superfamily II)
MSKRFIVTAAFTALLLVSSSAIAQNLDDVEFTTTELSNQLFMLEGAGGNIGLLISGDRVLLIDDQFAPLHEKLMAEIARLAGGEVDREQIFLLNTHFHHDHTKGNPPMGKGGALIFAHDNVRDRLTSAQHVPFFDVHTEAMDPSGLPVMTFSEDVTLHFDDGTAEVMHLPHAHTDGDAIVWFPKHNVLHTGDILFTGTYPFMDIDNGGSYRGTTAAVGKILELTNAETKFIPGHGKSVGRDYVEKYHTMLVTTIDRIAQSIAEGKALDETIAAKPTAEFDAELSTFITAEKYVGLVYRDLSK